jgi:phage terminase small subunit
MLRESIEERSALRALVMQSQSTDARKALRDLDKQIISQLSLLGFDPAARSRLGLAEVKAQSTLEKLRHNRGKDNA